MSQADPTPSNRSSWGGGGWYDDIAKKWFMFASEISHNCGMAVIPPPSPLPSPSRPNLACVLDVALPDLLMLSINHC